ncbi:hypothetical protein PAPYR_12605 [Paratrimastix pyriformis]|uniref:Transmembrane protein n=1 Tax=Paratrimastix pyriformis TaxID=342808 RepID=A0ABQ8U591_9EUKA|nr:hypothetical protein PAPYR_12605 [Paratrimastix pyriformis]
MLPFVIITFIIHRSSHLLFPPPPPPPPETRTLCESGALMGLDTPSTNFTSNLIKYGVIGLALLVIALLVVFSLLPVIHRKKPFKKLDMLYTLSHPTEYGASPVIKKTSVGGLATVCFGAFVVGYVGFYIVPFIVAPYDLFLSLETNNTYTRTGWTMAVTLHGAEICGDSFEVFAGVLNATLAISWEQVSGALDQCKYTFVCTGNCIDDFTAQAKAIINFSPIQSLRQMNSLTAMDITITREPWKFERLWRIAPNDTNHVIRGNLTTNFKRLPLTHRSVPFVAGNIVPRSPPPTLIPDVNAWTHLHASLCVCASFETLPMQCLRIGGLQAGNKGYVAGFVSLTLQDGMVGPPDFSTTPFSLNIQLDASFQATAAQLEKPKPHSVPATPSPCPPAHAHPSLNTRTPQLWTSGTCCGTETGPLAMILQVVIVGMLEQYLPIIFRRKKAQSSGEIATGVAMPMSPRGGSILTPTMSTTANPLATALLENAASSPGYVGPARLTPSVAIPPSRSFFPGGNTRQGPTSL